MPIGVGYHSGSHFATVQALEPVLAAGELNLTFQGPPNERLDALLDRQVPATTTWGVPLYVAEAFGFRKILDATFMIGFLVTGADATKSDVDKYLAALRQAQQEIDLRPELYKHYHLRSVPEKYRERVDVRAFGTGERLVFLPYTREVFAQTQQWTESHQLFTSPAAQAAYGEAADLSPPQKPRPRSANSNQLSRTEPWRLFSRYNPERGGLRKGPVVPYWDIPGAKVVDFYAKSGAR